MTAVDLVLVEELFIGSNDASAGSSMEESVWGEVPDELVDRVLLFLPAYSQARFRSVCKRWKELMTSVAFLEQTVVLAFDRGYPVCILEVSGSQNRLLWELNARFKVREVEIPGLMLPPYWSRGNARVFSHSRLPLVGVAWWGFDQEGLQCWLLNLADQTWQELPQLVPQGERPDIAPELGWNMWMAPAEGMGYQVFFFHCASASLSTYSCTSTDWCSVSVLEAAPTLSPQLAAWMGLSPLPDPPDAHFKLISESDGNAVFGYSISSSPVPAVSLYKLDESHGSHWECVFSGLPPKRPAESVLCCSVHRAQIVGNLVLIVAGCSGARPWGRNSSHILAYNMLKRSCKWLDQALHPTAYRCFTLQEVSLVTPRISDLRL